MSATAALPITSFSPATPSEVQEIVRTLPKVLPHGGQSKPPLLHVTGQEVARLDMTSLTGITEYDPGEYTFTAFAGTKLAEIAAALAEHGQYMPFDPPFVDKGATLGGAIAAGLSGSGRYRYGGLRDFIIGVQIVDGQGRLIRGGGKVVKNAAGFDLPKLMAGSLGRLGILISASFKVFPAPLAMATLIATLPNLSDALAAMARLMGGPYDLESLDLAPQASDSSVTLYARIGGPAGVLATRLERMRRVVGSGELLLDDSEMWDQARRFVWRDDGTFLVKAPTTVQMLPKLDQALSTASAKRRYAVGGNLTWIAWHDSLQRCHHLLEEFGISGLVVLGESERALIGKSLEFNFLDRVRAALDPDHRFVEFV